MPIRFNIFLPRIYILAMVLVFGEAVCAAPKQASGNKTPQPTSAIPTTIITMPSKPRPMVDTAAIRKLYLDGDFDVATEILETGMREKRPFNHADSVFIFKHLGVMYAAKYDTRERGKYFMHQLLMTEPTAKIMDMYASDMIYMIFKNIQDEFDSNRAKYDRAETHVAENRRDNRESNGGKAAYYWVGAGAIAAAGVAAFFVLQDEPKTTTTTVKHTVP